MMWFILYSVSGKFKSSDNKEVADICTLKTRLFQSRMMIKIKNTRWSEFGCFYWVVIGYRHVWWMLSSLGQERIGSWILNLLLFSSFFISWGCIRWIRYIPTLFVISTEWHKSWSWSWFAKFWSDHLIMTRNSNWTFLNSNHVLMCTSS